jgi:anti-anti-sigma factor
MTVIKAFVSSDVAHLVISGRLVHGEGASSGVQRAILRCSASYFKLLVVDLGDVDQMDTAGLSALMVAYSAAYSLGARFALARVPQAIHDLVTAAGLDSVFLLSQPSANTFGPSADLRDGHNTN